MMKVIAERKLVAIRLAELIGADVVYTRVPRCAYMVGAYIFEKDGSITVDEGADTAPLCTLAVEGLVGGVRTCEDRSQRQEEGDSVTIEANSTNETAGTDDAVTPTDRADGSPETDNSPDTLTISLPLAGHTANSLRNLVAMIYARGTLISKATGGSFSCTAKQVAALHDCQTVEDVIACLTDDLVGLRIKGEHIIFAGYPHPDSTEQIRAFSNLAVLMNKAAKSQSRVTAKPIVVKNERYAFRIWLLAIDMRGKHFATTRRILLAPLSGKAAFKDDAMEERWKNIQIQKRKVLHQSNVAT